MDLEGHLDHLTLDDHLTNEIILHILSFLPTSHKAAVAKLVCKAAHSAFKEYKTISITSCGDLPSQCVLEALKQMQRADERGIQIRLMAAVALQGDLPRLQLLRDHGCDWDWTVCAAAARTGHLDILQWLRAEDPPCPWNNHVCISAAAGGHLNVLQWVRAQNPPFDWTIRACEAAAGGGHLAVVQWIVSQAPRCLGLGSCAAWAACHGHLHVLQWLRAHNSPCDWNDRMCLAAASNGHLNVLQWLRAQDPPCPWANCVCSAAAEGGHLEVLQWLRARESPCPWDSGTTLVVAAGGGHLHVFEWALAQDPPAPWHHDGGVALHSACYSAIYSGHLNILQWVEAHQPALPWNKARCLEIAVEKGQVEIVKWLKSIGGHEGVSSTDCFVSAYRHGDHYSTRPAQYYSVLPRPSSC